MEVNRSIPVKDLFLGVSKKFKRVDYFNTPLEELIYEPGYHISIFKKQEEIDGYGCGDGYIDVLEDREGQDFFEPQYGNEIGDRTQIGSYLIKGNAIDITSEDTITAAGLRILWGVNPVVALEFLTKNRKDRFSNEENTVFTLWDACESGNINELVEPYLVKKLKK